MLPFCVQGEEWDIITIRNLYYKASASKEDSEKFKMLLQSISNPDQCIKGYIAASYMIDAKHAYNPATKLSYFNNGKNMLDDAIKNAPAHIELRFLRISIQTNAPSFLEYNKQIEMDKNFILSMYASQKDSDLKKRIREFMNASDICTEQEKKLLNGNN
jgi:hypothetical protein